MPTIRSAGKAPAGGATRERRFPPVARASALAGVAAAAVGIAASEVLTGQFGGPSVVIAFGALVIDLQPPGAKDVVISLFGTDDKLALNLAVLAVGLALGGLAGIVAGRRFDQGAAVLVAVGAVAAGASLRVPLASPPLVALDAFLSVGAALVTLRLLLGLAPRPDCARPGPGPAATERRVPRPGGVAGAGGRARDAGMVATSLPDRERRHARRRGSVRRWRPGHGRRRGLERRRRRVEAPGCHPGRRATFAGPGGHGPGRHPLVVANDAFYRIDTALTVPDVDVSLWTLEITGMVDHPLSLTYDELLAMPLFEQYVTIACVSNPVAGHLVGNALWTGVRLRDVLRTAGVQPGATQIVGHSYQDFWAGFPTSWAMAPEREPMIAVGMNRVPLPAVHGFPARLVVPGLYGYVSATKWLTGIQLTTRDAIDGYWVPLGWAKDGPIVTQSRIDVPAYNARVPPGRVRVAGVAWAPDRGISAVEVRIDDGPWQPARIAPPISAATWVQWEYDWTAATGRHHLEVRATDGTGDVQTDQVSGAAPSGAHGHDRSVVTVA